MTFNWVTLKHEIPPKAVPRKNFDFSAVCCILDPPKIEKSAKNNDQF